MNSATGLACVVGLIVTVTACGKDEASPSAPGTCPAGMVLVPGGTFQTGSGGENEEPMRTAKVDSFCMDVTEVTVDAYMSCYKCEPPGRVPHCNWGSTEKANHPINCVDWAQAARYCESFGKRLPSEDEWEYAARGGGEQLRYPWGSEAPSSGSEPPLDRACWNRFGTKFEPSIPPLPPKRTRVPLGTCEAGSHLPGAFGLRDMAGNVAEWTSSSYSNNPIRPGAAGTQMVSRGGSWTATEASSLLGAARSGADPSRSGPELGFRCVRGLP